ncbi:MAG TPA: flagellar hook-basal body complex protein [Phycisphaerae bacterium]|nr:flagellar hook-basal body complex protein [Phycisphaerae bacterium]
MGNALTAGVSGLKAHQQMLDVSGNNLANLNTRGFKSSRVNFSELLGENFREAQQPSDTSGGTNPMGMGGGVKVSSIDRDMGQGTLVNTGQPLDMAIEGSGFFCLNNGGGDVYTRVGTFAIDADYNLVDPATGYHVQRTGAEGIDDGFQDASNSNIRIPFDTALPANATSQVTLTGNLSADEIDPTTQELGSGTAYTTSTGTAASSTNELWQTSIGEDMDGTQNLCGTITINGTMPDGTTISSAGTLAVYDGSGVNPATTVADLLDNIRSTFGNEVTATMIDGQIRIKDDASGYSVTDITLTYAAAASNGTDMDLPAYWKILEAGGQATKNTSIEVFDSQGVPHILTGSFVKTDTINEWDFVMTSITGDIASIPNRRISRLSFLSDGSYGGIAGSTPDTSEFSIGLNGGLPSMDITVDLGRSGQYNGLSQFGGSSTAAPNDQNGYSAGWLSDLSVGSDGTLVGVFTNGIRRDIASMKIATFQNPAGMMGVGSNYFEASANSGDPVTGTALSGGAGSIRGQALENSNVEVATEFVNLIQAQNGYQANARTIRVANDMLKELTNLIR